ncbi:tRNA A37 threonylcarbamoyladenosine dehydratase [Dysgonomonadaceae bacterium PH5-43]|nr:tRNA A37 threonylcarbamoyladenosine dehydratase [Dysgonomonadaceae bacterium PH5-43]
MLFQRTEILLGSHLMNSISQCKIILFGVGGVGGWCAECLVRTGFKNITIVDDDVVMESNINRQLPASINTLGLPKVEVLKERFLSINPDANIIALQKRYTPESSHEFNLDSFDFIIDAIDSLKDKAHLILSACNTEATLLSSMGAALKLDPTKIKTTEFWKVKGDPLARALRQHFKKCGKFPSRKFQCVYSEERLSNKIADKANGTVMHITASFGLMLASSIVQEIIKRDAQ